MSAFDDDGNKSYKFTVTPDHFRAIAQLGGSGMRFSRIEIIHIVISVVALTFAFSLMIVGGISGLSGLNPPTLLFIIGVSFVAVSTGFLLHEIAHKRVAQGYNCYAEYRMYPMGLMIGLFSAAFGFLLALPGAVMIAGRITMKQNGLISLAGPSMNMLIAVVCMPMAFVFSSEPLLLALFGMVTYINALLAIFNLLPVPPLDGSKIFQWNFLVYIGVMAAAVALIASYFILISPLYSVL
jgi:Zn-dependent protease